MRKRRVKFWLYWQRHIVRVRLLPSLECLRRRLIRTRYEGMTVNSFECQLNNHRMTSSDLQKEWQMAAGVTCAVRTVWNRLLQAGLKSCKATKKSFINEKQRRAKLRLARDHKDWTIEDWSKVIYSDESNFQLCPIPGRLMDGYRHNRDNRRRPVEPYKPVSHPL